MVRRMKVLERIVISRKRSHELAIIATNSSRLGHKNITILKRIEWKSPSNTLAVI